MSLTDDWKAGKLPCWDYYVKTKDGIVLVDYFADSWDFILDDNVDEILCEVPSYDELQDLKSQIKHLKDLQANEDKEIEGLILENDNLRELLSEASGCIQGELKKQIEEILGESEEK